MSTNKKTANEIIWKLKEEKTYLLKTLEAANDLIEADTEMHAKDVEKSTALIKLAKENDRLRKSNNHVLEALKNARQFISNGIELGYIAKPEPGQPEAQTLGIIVDAIRKAEEGTP